MFTRDGKSRWAPLKGDGIYRGRKEPNETILEKLKVEHDIPEPKEEIKTDIQLLINEVINSKRKPSVSKLKKIFQEMIDIEQD
jgi:hypothetical protein